MKEQLLHNKVNHSCNIVTLRYRIIAILNRTSQHIPWW